MIDSLKRTKADRKAEFEWINISKSKLDRALDSIQKHQDRKLLNTQTIMLVFLGALFVNLLSSALFNLNGSVIAISIIAIIIIFFIVNRELSAYEPSFPFLSFLLMPENAKDYLNENQFIQFIDYLEQGKITDFISFANNFFKRFNTFSSFMFPNDIKIKPIREIEEPEFELEESFKKFPSVTKEFDLSPLNHTGVNATLEVKVAPDLIHISSPEPILLSFHILYKIRIKNPRHRDAGKFLESFYYSYCHKIFRYSCLSIGSVSDELIRGDRHIENSAS